MKTPPTRPLTGIVLCGGKSLRMGRDKGLIKRGTKPWSQIAVEKMATICPNSYISIRNDQWDAYRNYFSADQLLPDDVLIKDKYKGPLVGLLTAFTRLPEADIFVLAADMPDMNLATIKQLFTTYHQKPCFSCYAYYLQDHFESLCAIYRNTAVQSLMNDVQSPHLFSLQRLLKQNHTLALVPTPTQSEVFKNYNTPP